MKRLFSILSLVIVFAILFTSCRKKEEPPTSLVEDGYYLVGGSAPSDTMVLMNMLEQGYVEGEGFAAEPYEGMFQKFAYLTANGGGFMIKQQAGSETYSWGIDGDWTNVVGDTVLKASMKLDGGAFSVPKDGFYLIVADFNTKRLYLLRIEKWSVIGDATEGGWGDDSQQELTEVSLNAEGGQWTIENLILYPRSFKLRFNHWWTYHFADPNAGDNGDPKFFTNLGGSLDELTPGGANIEVAEGGYYTLTLNYVYGDKFSATLEKTGDLEPDDISQDTISLIGSGIGYVEGGIEHMVENDWEEDIDLEYQGVDNYVYTFTLDSFIVTNSAQFKFRKNHSWDVNWGISNVTLQGDVDDISGTDNFVSSSDKIYNVSFEYDGLTFETIVTLTYISDYTPATPDDPSQHTFSFIGSAFYQSNDPNNSATNWDTDFDLTYDGIVNNNYQFSYTGLYFIGGGEFKIRRDHDWGISYGYNEMTITGDGANNINDPGNGNIGVTADAQYNCTLTMDDSFGNMTLDLSPAN